MHLDWIVKGGVPTWSVVNGGGLFIKNLQNSDFPWLTTEIPFLSAPSIPSSKCCSERTYQDLCKRVVAS